jgi:hypothetical protein
MSRDGSLQLGTLSHTRQYTIEYSKLVNRALRGRIIDRCAIADQQVRSTGAAIFAALTVLTTVDSAPRCMISSPIAIGFCIISQPPIKEKLVPAQQNTKQNASTSMAIDCDR